MKPNGQSGLLFLVDRFEFTCEITEGGCPGGF